MRRSGEEPLHARSALRTRFVLALFGLLTAATGAAVFLALGHPGWAVGLGVVAVIAAIDLIVVARHIRQGPQFQPGPDVPPYSPVDGEPGFRDHKR